MADEITNRALQALTDLFRENEIPMSDRNGRLHDAIAAALALPLPALEGGITAYQDMPGRFCVTYRTRDIERAKSMLSSMQVEVTLANLLSKQKPLEAEFSEILQEHAWELYARDEGKSNAQA